MAPVGKTSSGDDQAELARYHLDRGSVHQWHTRGQDLWGAPPLSQCCAPPQKACGNSKKIAGGLSVGTRVHEVAYRYRGNGAGAMNILLTAAFSQLRLAGFQTIRTGGRLQATRSKTLNQHCVAPGWLQP